MADQQQVHIGHGAYRHETHLAKGAQRTTYGVQAKHTSRQWHTEHYTKGTSIPRQSADIQHAATGAPSMETWPMYNEPPFSSGTQGMKCGC